METIIQQYFKKCPVRLRKKIITEIETYEDATKVLYEILGKIHGGVSFQDIYNELVHKQFRWKGCLYKELSNGRAIQDKRIEDPPDIREGEIECPVCKTKKTFVVEQQLQRADEGFTYFIYCLNDRCDRKVTKTKNF